VAAFTSKKYKTEKFLSTPDGGLTSPGIVNSSTTGILPAASVGSSLIWHDLVRFSTIYLDFSGLAVLSRGFPERGIFGLIHLNSA
jgi:hypothetical protein